VMWMLRFVVSFFCTSPRIEPKRSGVNQYGLAALSVPGGGYPSPWKVR
jgi:hypothetical protein